MTAKIVPLLRGGYRGGMARLPAPSIFALAVLATLVLAACGGPAPYVFTEDEFNRDRPGFGQEPKNRDNVEICYNSHSTTPSDILAMAAAECGKYGKQAVFRYHEYMQCPVLTPARAHFDCVPK